MKKITHHLSGLGLAAVCYTTGAPVDFCCGIAFGSTAPDWMELPWWIDGIRISVIPHRTITHWLLLWLAGLLISTIYPDSDLSDLAKGFFLGGILHVCLDAVTPMGVPLIFPKRIRLPDAISAGLVIALSFGTVLTVSH